MLMRVVIVLGLMMSLAFAQQQPVVNLVPVIQAQRNQALDWHAQCEGERANLIKEIAELRGQLNNQEKGK